MKKKNEVFLTSVNGEVDDIVEWGSWHDDVGIAGINFECSTVTLAQPAVCILLNSKSSQNLNLRTLKISELSKSQNSNSKN